ncbi:Gfo/Idh/MocA family protein [Sphingorhabdus arenilitoris]|uniref:Gfo/Idh/MocA family protein n=1 Tax=Sphingorhabdus arenilitoris TaxID=1490041 RepID=A0ABV8REN2_9SPHN
MPTNQIPTRRQILTGAALLPLALTAGKAAGQTAKGQPLLGKPDLPDPMDARTGWAIVGLGSFGVGQVIPAFADAKKSRLAAFVSGNAEKATMLGQRYDVPNIYDYNNFDNIADNPDISCVYIVLPVGLHAEYTIRALRAGKHVLCEKPMASSPAECEAMIAAAKAADKQLGVAYRVYFEPANIEAQRRIAAGEIGTIRHVQCDHGFDANPQAWPPHKWRLEKLLGGGGSMYDIGIYGLNTSLMMMPNDRPVAASAVYVYPRDDPRFAEVEGGIDWRVTMESGANISGSSSYCYSPYVSRQRYFGDKASIEMMPATTYYDNDLIIEGAGPRRHIGTAPAIQQFAAQVDGFSEAARNGQPHRTPGEMGLRDMRIIAALYESADKGGVPVKL